MTWAGNVGPMLLMRPPFWNSPILQGFLQGFLRGSVNAAPAANFREGRRSIVLDRREKLGKAPLPTPTKTGAIWLAQPRHRYQRYTPTKTEKRVRGTATSSRYRTTSAI